MPDVADLVGGVLDGRRAAVSQAITLVESSRPEHRAQARDLLAALESGGHRPTAVRVGISGVPGVGKSTFIEALGTRLTTDGHRVGVLAVDPSSTRTGGSVLGDKTRMGSLAADPHAYIRPSPSAGTLGGVARATSQAMLVLEAAGYDVVLVETVGVGQDEVDVVSTVDTVLVVAVPGLGDDIQAIKAGLMEIGDVFVINKADREGVMRTEKEIETLLTLGHRDDMWSPPIVKTVATSKAGMSELAAAIDSYKTFLDGDAGRGAARRERVAEQRVLDLLRERLMRDALARLGPGDFERLAAGVADRSRDPYSVVEEIVGWKR